MKKFFLPLAFLALSTYSIAQITITANDLPSIGDSHVRDSVELAPSSSTTFDSLFTAGLNPSWDATFLKGGEMDTIEFFDPSGTIYADSFPSANLVMKWDFDFVLSKDANGLSILGLGIESEVRSFDSAVSYTPVPFGLNDKIKSKGEAKFPFLIYDVAIQLDRDLEVFNYGSLKMPNDTVYEVLMVNAITEFSNLVLDDVDTISNSTEVEYAVEFYCKEFGFPILRVVLDEEEGQPEVIEYMDLVVSTSLKEATKEETQDLVVYPNPSNGQIHILANQKIMQVNIIDMLGKTVKQEMVNAFGADIYGLNKGVYIVSVSNGDKTITNKRIVVE